MNELSIATKFLFTVAGFAIVLSAASSLGHLTFKMAEAAIAAQQHDQMSYGKFSRMLWASHSKCRGRRPEQSTL
jgi:hypothetical protein